MNDQAAWKALAENPRYFIETFLYVVDKNRKKTPLLLNPAQVAYDKKRSNRDLILKARKEGFSTLIEALFLHACLFRDNVNAVTMSHTLDDTVIHLDRVKYFVETMGYGDVQVDCGVDRENQREISFPATNSRYWIGTAGSRTFGRGRDLTHLHLSEVAHYEDQRVLTGVMEACVPGATVILESTANGVGELFYKMWQEAKDPQSGSPWKRHFFSWFDDPTNRLAIPTGVRTTWNAEESRMKALYRLHDEQVYWHRKKRLSMPDSSKMPQEYPSNDDEAFLSSGAHLFNQGKLAEVRKKVSKAPWVGEVEDDGRTVAWRDDQEGRLRVWKHPRQNRAYLIAADVAEGVQDGDFSVAQVLDRSTWEQVAVWRGRTDPGTFGHVLCSLGYYFNSAVLLPENNNHGWGAIERIKREEYPHLLTTREVWPEDLQRNQKPGFPTDARSKGMAITALRNAVDELSVWINDGVTVDEMMQYVRYDSGEFGPADKVNGHDDCVMSLAIGVFSLRHLGVEEMYAARGRAGDDRAVVVTSVVPAIPKRRARAGTI